MNIKLTVILSLLLFIPSLCFGGVREAQEELADILEEINYKLPIDYGYMGTLDQIVYDRNNNEVRFFLTLGKEYVDVDEARKKQDSNIEKSIKNYLLQTEEKESFFPYFLNADAELILVIKNPESKDEVLVRFTVPQMEELMADEQTEEQICRRIVNRTVANDKRRCPKSLSAGVEMTDVNEKNGYIVYDLTIDEDIFSMEELKKTKTDIRRNWEFNITNEPLMNQFVNRVIVIGKGIIYNYTSNKTGERMPIIFTTEELKNVMLNPQYKR